MDYLTMMISSSYGSSGRPSRLSMRAASRNAPVEKSVSCLAKLALPVIQ
jgi:hypothetical protein